MCREIEASVAGVRNFVAVNQTLPHLCISSFTEKSLHVQKVIAKKFYQSHHCNISEALTEASYSVGLE